MKKIIVLLAFGTAVFGQPEGIREREVTVGQGEWALGGTLSLPGGPGPFPAVVLVHGSGPSDRDETIGPNKPFRDLAWGFARRGIAVLRYDKRTKLHGARMVAEKIVPTVELETIDDAVAAVALLRQTPEVDPARVFVFGHSMGGSLAPRIASRSEGVAGIVIAAGSTRPPGQIIADQARYLLEQAGDDDRKQASARHVLEQADRIRNLPDTDTEMILGAPVSYWRWWNRYDAAGEAATLVIPILVTQNGRDYQVTEADFAGWKTALVKRPNARLVTFPTLNHLFQQGSGPSTPEEYRNQTPVAEEFIEDVARWLLNPA